MRFNPLLYSKVSFDPNKDFVPVAPLLIGSRVLVAHPSVRANTHLAAELFMQMAGVDIVHAPYRGAGPALADLVGGQVHLMIDGIPLPCPISGQESCAALAPRLTTD